MEEITFLDSTSKKWFWSHLENEEQVNEVCEYLSENSLKIELHYYRDGCNVWLEGIDLSGNGCCFSGSNLMLHVRYFRRMKEISKTKEFNKWLKQCSKFDLVRRYILERDQRWLKIEELDEILK